MSNRNRNPFFADPDAFDVEPYDADDEVLDLIDLIDAFAGLAKSNSDEADDDMGRMAPGTGSRAHKAFVGLSMVLDADEV